MARTQGASSFTKSGRERHTLSLQHDLWLDTEHIAGSQLLPRERSVVFHVDFDGRLVVKLRRPGIDFSPLYAYDYLTDIAVVCVRPGEQKSLTSGGRKVKSGSKIFTGGV